MTDAELIPPPKVVQDRIARNQREARLLKRLYRLSIQAAEDRRDAADEDRRAVAV